MDFATVQRNVLAFRDERDWGQFHTPKDLAISVAIEAGELLECFQWTGRNVTADANAQRIREELADVLIYCMYLADSMGVDVPSADRGQTRDQRAEVSHFKSKGLFEEIH